MNSPSQHTWRVVLIIVLAAGIILLAFSGYLRPAMRIALNPLISIQGWVSSRYMAVVEFLTVPRDVASLRDRNAQLENENAQLQAQVIQLQQQLREAQVLYALLDFARARPENEYTAASVIGVDPSPFMRYIILDKGSDNNIRHGMPVVTEKGLVGRVDAVTAGAARVQLIIDSGSAVNVQLQGTSTQAMLTGSVTGDISLEMVPQDANLKIGELVLTSGLGGNYPSDVIVGQVLSVRKRETDLFQEAAIQPAVDFTNLRAVLVITNFRPVNIKPLLPGSP